MTTSISNTYSPRCAQDAPLRQCSCRRRCGVHMSGLSPNRNRRPPDCSGSKSGYVSSIGGPNPNSHGISGVLCHVRIQRAKARGGARFQENARTLVALSCVPRTCVVKQCQDNVEDKRFLPVGLSIRHSCNNRCERAAEWFRTQESTNMRGVRCSIGSCVVDRFACVGLRASCRSVGSVLVEAGHDRAGHIARITL